MLLNTATNAATDLAGFGLRKTLDLVDDFLKRIQGAGKSADQLVKDGTGFRSTVDNTFPIDASHPPTKEERLFAEGLFDDMKDEHAKDHNSQEYQKWFLDLADIIDVDAPSNSKVFYSGPGNRERAEEFAIANNKLIIELTPGGKYLDSLKLFDEKTSPLSRNEAFQVWARESKRFAESASGNTYAFIKGSNKDSIFNTIEYPSLLNNKNVTNIFSELME